MYGCSRFEGAHGSLIFALALAVFPPRRWYNRIGALMTSRLRELQGQPDFGSGGAAAASHQHVEAEKDG